ncbi:MAG: NAD(P)-dependent oxidoreductase [Legionellaceae bacterium]|nr:NAD(P)-dependent oxidoreductase [Legionellaceae bacterium]HAF86954.1 NAD(P)-dependent oxidoreductase [Legionellales bacterium]HCA88995.1 NAD(P)-dependent oxidoreductase [Legionellales bacterium]|tara:strand:- start:801 stop:1583 length:783 start_codon:yes stop_codon:yes gene_type:complete
MALDLPLKNTLVFITGASSGIGEATAIKLAALGANLIITARRIKQLTKLAESIQNTYQTEVLCRQMDVQSLDQVKTVCNNLPDAWQDIDILVNNAGLARATDPIQTGCIDNWEVMIDTNIKGLLYVTRMILPGMIARNKGHIVNIGSIAGQDCYPQGNIYSATKHAVRALTKSLRLDLLGTPLRVSEIAPGAVETEFSTVRWQDTARAQAFYADFTPLTATDIAETIAFCVTRPAHVNIAEMTVFPTDQAACSVINRQKI